MCSLNDLHKGMVNNIYKSHPQLIKNIISKMGHIESVHLYEFIKTFGPNWVVCLKDSKDGFRILLTLSEFAVLNNNRTSTTETNIDLFLCDYDFEFFRDVIYLDEIEFFLP
jgi:hypothetical protein